MQRFNVNNRSDQNFVNEIPEDSFIVEKYNARKKKEENQKKIPEILKWFEEYDNQVKQYQRCVRLGIEFDKDIVELDNQAKAYQEELRQLKQGV